MQKNTRFIQTRFGELRLLEVYEDLLGEADQYYPKHLELLTETPAPEPSHANKKNRDLGHPKRNTPRKHRESVVKCVDK